MKFSSDVVHDATNLAGLLLLGAGIWLAFGLGYALIAVGVAVLALNFGGR